MEAVQLQEKLVRTREKDKMKFSALQFTVLKLTLKIPLWICDFHLITGHEQAH